METVDYNGWPNSVRLANSEVELIVTQDVGPRVIRFGFQGERNIFGELPSHQGGSGEDEWMIRGGHRFWVAPEEMPKTYELDNGPVPVEEIPNGVRTLQPAGPLAGLAKTIEITLEPGANRVRVVHTLTNESGAAVEAAPWALTVMAQRGMAIIPLPEKIAHTDRLTHVQEWSIWGYTDFSDPRWTLGSRYIFFRQDPERGPNKLGIMHREGWVAYWLDGFVFVKRFNRDDSADYCDGGVNFETFSNEDILELESLGALGTIEPGASASHEETWELFRDIPPITAEADADKHIARLVG